jgi:pimeloyl-ACP methyl ester carboxylesterase
MRSNCRLLAMLLLVATVTHAVAQPASAGRTRGGIAYDVQGQGPAVVLITGTNLDRRMWTRESGWLASTRTVVRYDLRAHGARPPDTATQTRS